MPRTVHQISGGFVLLNPEDLDALEDELPTVEEDEEDDNEDTRRSSSLASEYFPAVSSSASFPAANTSSTTEESSSLLARLNPLNLLRSCYSLRPYRRRESTSPSSYPDSQQIAPPPYTPHDPFAALHFRRCSTTGALLGGEAYAQPSQSQGPVRQPQLQSGDAVPPPRYTPMDPLASPPLYENIQHSGAPISEDPELMGAAAVRKAAVEVVGDIVEEVENAFETVVPRARAAWGGFCGFVGGLGVAGAWVDGEYGRR